jgi:FAD/FMN-containing dehydrogenase
MVGREELVKIIGSQNVADGSEALEEYTKDLSFVQRIRPGSVVKADSAEAVQAIVKWANQTRTPLVPVSSGAPHFHGDTVPGVGGAVVVDLSGMKRIIRVDRRNRIAMIEPGVTFGELIPALEKEGLAPFMTFLPRSSKSVVTSFLERTPITIPRHHWEAQDPLHCVEVIYGDGELMRTGSAAGPGTLEEQWKVGRAQLRGMGPSQVDFTRLLQGAQGTMGIVTWATIRCRPLPKVKRSYMVVSDDIEPLIDLAYRITYKKLGEELLIMSNAELCSVMGKERESIEKLKGVIPPWILYYSIEGDGFFPEDKVAYQEKETIKLAQEIGLELRTEISEVSAEEVSAVLCRPSRDPYWKLGSKGSNQDIFFITTLDRSPEFISRMYELADKCAYASEDIGIYLQPTIQGCNCHLEFSLNYSPEDKMETDAVRQLVEGGAEVLAKMGGFFSRPHGTWSRFAYDREGMTVIGQRRLKDIFDPKGIMNPGKLCY